MPVFEYTGFNVEGKSVAGTLEAPSERDALQALSGGGVIPVSIAGGSEAAAGHGAATGRARRTPGRERISVARRTLFVRELASFLHADIPLLEALAVLCSQEEDPHFRTILEDVHDRVQGGEAFSKALAVHPRVFPPLLVTMVRVGETGGMLAKVLEQMAVWMEQEEEVQKEIRGAMTYPIMILLLGVATVIILLTFVLPRILTIFAGMRLPLPTRILMGSSDFMSHWWKWLLVGGIVLGYGLRRALRADWGKRFWDRAALRLPIFGKLMIKASIARFARASAALLGSGVPLLEALRVVRGLVPNTVILAIIEGSIERVTRGQSLARALGESPVFPPSVIHLLAVGERTGRLGEMFERVAQAFEKQTRAQIKILLNLLSPMLIVCLAVLVAFIAISILLPIFEMNKLVR
ncbi:MAG: type II secretion system F family protein [bacterium]|nr:type II secretion system F family protein [bacterium]